MLFGLFAFGAPCPGLGQQLLELAIDIQATKPDGFDESEVRTIGENARVLKFDPSSGFEKS